MIKFIKENPLVCVFVFVTIACLPFIWLRDFTPSNELRYLNIVDEALQGGHFFTFTNQGAVYADKPPLYFWLMMLCRVIAGKHCMGLLSLLSLIPALGIVKIMTSWVGIVRPMPTLTKAAMALMTCTTALFLGLAVFLRMDMLMCLFIVLSLRSFYYLYTGHGNPRTESILLPVWIFLALFTKGPVGLLMPVVSILVFLIAEGKLRETGRYLGWKTWGIIALLSALWFGSVLIEGDKSYLNNLLFHQTLDRAVNAFHHKKPFYYYFVCLWYVMAPYAFMLISGMIVWLCKYLHRKDNDPASKEFLDNAARPDNLAKLFICAATTTLLMLSAFSSKLAVYLLPAFPFIIYLFPLIECRLRWNRWWRLSLAVPFGLLAGVGAVGLIGLCVGGLGIVPEKLAAMVEEYSFVFSAGPFIGLGLLTAGSILGLVLLREGWERSVIVFSAGLLSAVFCISTAVPKANPYLGYGALCEKAKIMAPHSSVSTLFVSRPENMNVYLGKDIIDWGKDVEGFMASQPSGTLLIVKNSKLLRHPDLVEWLHPRTYCKVGGHTIYRFD